MHSVDKVTAQLRDYVGNPRIQSGLMGDIGNWFQLCSSLDVIEDCQLALESYENIGLRPSLGKLYLAVYGLLQTSYVQQDAIFNLCQALDIKDQVQNYPHLLDVRYLRHDVAGHPTHRSHPGGTTFNFIVRASLTKEGFDVHSVDDVGQSKTRHIDLGHVIAQQETYVIAALRSAIRKLRGRDKAHRRKFRMDRLKSTIPATMDYHLGKVCEVATGSTYQEFARPNFEVLEKSLDDFKEALARRGMTLDTYDSIKYLYLDLQYPMGKISAWIGNRTSLDDEAAYVFTWYLRERIKELEHIAEEIDTEYDA